jgi:hypothetical protein
MVMTAEELKAMRGGGILALVHDRLLDAASAFSDCVARNGNDPSKWDWSRHDAMCAAALLIDGIRATGKDQVERKVKVDRLVEQSVDRARSMLIGEALKRGPKDVAPGEVAA